jgi:hypothetical protein
MLAEVRPTRTPFRARYTGTTEHSRKECHSVLGWYFSGVSPYQAATVDHASKLPERSSAPHLLPFIPVSLSGAMKHHPTIVTCLALINLAAFTHDSARTSITLAVAFRHDETTRTSNTFLRVTLCRRIFQFIQSPSAGKYDIGFHHQIEITHDGKSTPQYV